MKIERIKGFRDHYPEDMEIRYSVFTRITNVAENFGYQRIDFPSLEYLEMYKQKSGSELVSQTFSFTDKGGREVTMILEATPSTVRLLTARKDIPRPVRWYSLPKVWRYEEPQEGRFREHYQFNADMFGLDSAEADSEIIGLAAQILDELGLSGKYQININDRQVMEYILNDMNIQNIHEAFSVIDKYRKITREQFISMMAEINVDKKNTEKILDLLSERLDIKDFEKKLKSILNNFDGLKNRIERLKTTFSYISFYTKSDIKYDFSVVRGLSYYTGIVFEAFDSVGELRAILGGGRYDGLSTLFSDENIPAIGFAIGDAVLEILLKKYNLWEKYMRKQSYYICNLGSQFIEYSINLASKIRKSNRIALVDITGRKLSSQIKSAAEFDFALIIGENEVKSGTVTLKDMKTGEQKTIEEEEFYKLL